MTCNCTHFLNTPVPNLNKPKPIISPGLTFQEENVFGNFFHDSTFRSKASCMTSVDNTASNFKDIKIDSFAQSVFSK
jgi:hypothetical protein